MPASLDANTLGLWRLNDADSAGAGPATFADEAGNLPLTTTNGPFTGYDGTNGFGSAEFTRTSNQFGVSGVVAALDAACAGDLTFEGWFFPHTAVNFETLLSLNMNSHPNPFLVGYNSTSGIYGQWVNAAGTLISYGTGVTIPLKKWTHVGLRRQSTGSGNYNLDFFYNGAKVDSHPMTGGVKGGSNMLLYLGASGFGSPGGDALDGRLWDVRFSKVARSDAEILATYQSGFPTFGAASQPKLTGVTAVAAGYRKNLEGEVALKGKIKAGTIGLAAFTLPVGYRPDEDKDFAVHSEDSSSTVHGVVRVTTTGDVIPLLGGNALVSLDGIRFWGG